MKITHITERAKQAKAKDKKPKVNKPHKGHQSPHPMQGKMVGEDLRDIFFKFANNTNVQLSESELQLIQEAPGDIRKFLTVLTLMGGLVAGGKMAMDATSFKQSVLGQELKLAAEQGDEVAAYHYKNLDLYADANDQRTIVNLKLHYIEDTPRDDVKARLAKQAGKEPNYPTIQKPQGSSVKEQAFDYDMGMTNRDIDKELAPNDKLTQWKQHLIYRFGIKNMDLSIVKIENIVRRKSLAMYKELMKQKDKFFAGDVDLKTESTFNEAYSGTKSVLVSAVLSELKKKAMEGEADNVKFLRSLANLIGKKITKRDNGSYMLEKKIPFTQCPKCGGDIIHESELLEAKKKKKKQDACYHKVKSRYKVWPSAYASGALVQCRKKGAKNWGNKSKKK